MTVLVTGGAGYIGSCMVRELQRRGYDTVVYDNLDTGHRRAVGGVPFVEADISNTYQLLKTMVDYRVDSVLHFAAKSLVGESLEKPGKYYRNNVCGTLSLLEAMRRAGVNRIVFSSTAAIYGEPEEVPITEDSPQKPTNVYGQSKLMIEKILSDFETAHGIKYMSLRYFNAAGADPEGNVGEDHNPETHLIPIIMQVLLGKRKKLSIFGTDYPTPDGTCIRDYVHVLDLADAHILALERLKNGGDSQAYNLGCQSGYSVREVIDTVEKVTGKRVPCEEAPPRPGDPATLVASSKKIKKQLGWTPRFNSLKKIIQTAWNWHKNNPDGYGD